MIFFTVLAVLGGAFVYNKERIKVWLSKNQSWLPSFGYKLIMFLITMQIIVMLKMNHER